MKQVKKKLPFIILGLGALVLVVGFVVLRKPSQESFEEEAAPEIALEMRPVASLTPSEDGHWLKLVIEKFEIDAATLDYELLYKLPDGRTQGVPGTAKLDGSKIERDLLLGSESSGKFRYDEGVEAGTLTLRFRNDKGKLAAKFTTEFNLLFETTNLSSADGQFTFDLASPTDDYYIVMSTFGMYELPGSDVLSGPYGVFSSGGDLSGEAGNFLFWNDSSWVDKADGPGIFVRVN